MLIYIPFFIMAFQAICASGSQEAPQKVLVEAVPEASAKGVMSRHTFALIKPDAVSAGVVPDILRYLELNGFVVERMEKRTLTKAEAQEFYAQHAEKPFFNDIVSFITSGPVIGLVLSHADEGNVVSMWRACMGKTDPAQARMGSLRYMFGTDIQKNAVHGSDSVKAYQREMTLFFGSAIALSAVEQTVAEEPMAPETEQVVS